MSGVRNDPSAMPDVAVLPPRVRRQRRHDGVLDLLAAKRRFVERRHDAVDAERRRRAGDQQQIAAGPFDDLLQPPAQARGLGVVSGGGAGVAHRGVEAAARPRSAR